MTTIAVAQDENVAVFTPGAPVCPFAGRLIESGAQLVGPYKGGIQPIERVAEVVTTIGPIKIVVKLFAVEFDGDFAEFDDRKQAVAWLRENRKNSRGANRNRKRR